MVTKHKLEKPALNKLSNYEPLRQTQIPNTLQWHM